MIRNEVEIGPNSMLNGLIMYRKVGDLPFIPQYYFDGDSISNNSSIIVNYVEFYKNNDGLIIDELSKNKTYVISGSKAVNWFTQLARTPINNVDGIMDSIEETLAQLPLHIPTGYNLI